MAVPILRRYFVAAITFTSGTIFLRYSERMVPGHVCGASHNFFLNDLDNLRVAHANGSHIPFSIFYRKIFRVLLGRNSGPTVDVVCVGALRRPAPNFRTGLLVIENSLLSRRIPPDPAAERHPVKNFGIVQKSVGEPGVVGIVNISAIRGNIALLILKRGGIIRVVIG